MAEIHIWRGLKPPVYHGIQVLVGYGPAMKGTEDFPSANDVEAPEYTPEPTKKPPVFGKLKIVK